jgi:hypothetical protein
VVFWSVFIYIFEINNLPLQMKRIFITLLMGLCFFPSSRLFAQLPNGSTAPDFTTTDINGNTHNLYEYLEQGKTVILKFTATWCGPCWNYHQSGALEDTWEQFGPPGTDEAVVLFLESDPNTALECLYGNCPNTLGDWVTGTPFPQINDHNMAGPYAISFYPTIYGVCPNKKTTVLGQVPASVIGSFIADCKNITYDALVQNVTCHGQNDGTISLENVSAAEPVQYLWSNGSTESSINNLAPGFYNCTISDPFGNSVTTENFQIQEPDFLYLEIINISNIDCYNEEGYASVEAIGGNENFQFQWSNGQSGNELFVSEGGLFNVSVVDNKGCANELVVEVEVNTQIPDISAGPDKSLACNENSLQLEGSGPNASEFQILWTTADGEIFSGESTYSPTVLMEGTYQLQVLNTLTGCEASSLVQVTRSEGPQFTLSSQGASCYGSSDGNAEILDLSPSNASILWSTGENTLVIQQLPAGLYSVTVGEGPCESIEEFTVLQPDSLVVGVQIVQESGEGNNDGSIVASGSGGTAPYAYLWSNGSENASIDSLSAGTYTLTLTDSQGCTQIQEIVLGTQTCDLMVTIQVVSPIACFGADNGELLAVVEGDTTGLLFTWSTGGFNENTLTNLSTGQYSVTISNGNQCFALDSIELVQPQEIAILFSYESESEPGAMDGRISAEVTGGVPDYFYEWSNGPIDTAEISSLANGQYCLTVTDSNQCTAVSCLTLQDESCLLTAQIQIVQDILCHGDSTGVLAVVYSGNVGPVDILWNTGSINENLSNLGTGFYQVLLVDSLGCSIQSEIQFNQPVMLEAYANSTKPSTPSSNDGSLVLEISGGLAPYTLLWDDGSSDSLILGAAGNYCVTITDANACTVEICESIPEAGCNDLNIVANIIQPVICKGTETGAVEFIVAGGYPDYSIALSTQSDLNALKSGDYIAIVTDNEGCVDSVLFVIEEPNDFLAMDYTVTPSISVQGTGKLEIVPTGGWGDYYVELRKASDIVSNQEYTIENLESGSYTIHLRDGQSCSITDSFEIQLNTSQNNHGLNKGNLTLFPNPAKDIITLSYDKGIALRSLSINTLQGVHLRTQWNPAISSQINVDVSGLPAGIYILSLISLEGEKIDLKFVKE